MPPESSVLYRPERRIKNFKLCYRYDGIFRNIHVHLNFRLRDADFCKRELRRFFNFLARLLNKGKIYFSCAASTCASRSPVP